MFTSSPIINKPNLLPQNLQVELEKANKGLDVLSEKKKASQNSLESLQTEHDKYFEMLKDVKAKCEDEKAHIQQMQIQLSSQESSNKEEEENLGKARKELEDLKSEELELQARIEKNKKHLEMMKSKTAAAKTDIHQVSFFKLLIFFEIEIYFFVT